MMKVIPAHPLALNSARKMDERRQRALTRYYIAAGVDGLAVGVHTRSSRFARSACMNLSCASRWKKRAAASS
jgi:hypothetical protein